MFDGRSSLSGASSQHICSEVLPFPLFLVCSVICPSRCVQAIVLCAPYRRSTGPAARAALVARFAELDARGASPPRRRMRFNAACQVTAEETPAWPAAAAAEIFGNAPMAFGGDRGASCQAHDRGRLRCCLHFQLFRRGGPLRSSPPVP